MMHHELTINLKDLTRNLLETFLDTAPGDADLSLTVGWHGTNPWEEQRPEDLDIEIKAEWDQPL